MSAPTLGTDWRADLAALPSGWDSYGGKPISEAALATLAGFSVVPCHDGGIQLEAHRDGLDIEIDISAEGKIESVLVGPSPSENAELRARVAELEARREPAFHFGMPPDRLND